MSAMKKVCSFLFIWCCNFKYPQNVSFIILKEAFLEQERTNFKQWHKNSGSNGNRAC